MDPSNIDDREPFMKGLGGLGSQAPDSTKYKYLEGQIHSQDIFGEDDVSTGNLLVSSSPPTGLMSFTS